MTEWHKIIQEKVKETGKKSATINIVSFQQGDGFLAIPGHADIPLTSVEVDILISAFNLKRRDDNQYSFTVSVLK